MRIPVCLCVASLLAGACLAAQDLPRFRERVISKDLKFGYQLVAADLNGDGKKDLIAIDERATEVAWFENPTWTRHVLATNVPRPLNAACWDIDGDGIPEVVLAYHFETRPEDSVGNVVLLTHGPDVRLPWTMRELDRVPTAHRVRWIDPEGNGKKVLLLGPMVGRRFPPVEGDSVPIYLYRPGPWTRETISNEPRGVLHAINPVSWDGGARQQLLTASYAGLHRLELLNGKWVATRIAQGDPRPWPLCGSSEVRVGHLGPRRILVAIEPWHGNQVVVYLPEGAQWKRVVLEDKMENGHALAVGDLDGDGRDEIVCGFRGRGCQLSIYQAMDASGERWRKTVLDDGGIAAADCVIDDFTGDGRPDIVCIGASTGNLKLYENLGGTQDNWPSFRGANADGMAKGTATPVNWDAKTSENILWKTAIPGLGHSSPIIWGERLFVTTAVNQRQTAPLKVGLYGDPESAEDNDIQQWKVLCLNKRSGAILWEQTAREGVPRQKRHPKATHANCTMATDGASVVAFFGSEGLYCYDLDGRLRWQKDWGTLRTSPVVYNDKPDPQGVDLEWGFASSPIIYGDRVFVQCDVLTNGFVAALNLADGKEVWRSRRDDTATWSTPNICVEGQRPQLLVNGWKHMGGYDLRTGEEIWRMSGGGDCPVPTPVVGNGLIFLTSAHGPRRPLYAVRTDAIGDVSLRGGATTNQYVAWSALRGGSYMQTPLVYGDYLYSCHIDGILSCYEAKTGREMYKERLGTGGDGFTASPVASTGKLYFTSERGAVFVVKPGEHFSVLATNQMGEVCMATPAVSEGTIFFRTQGHVLAVGERKP